MRLVNPCRTLIYRSVHIGSTLELWLYLQKHKLDYFHPHTDQVARQVVRNKASNSVEGKFLAYLILVNINSSRCQVFKVHGGEFQNIVTRPMKLRCFSRKNGIWMQWRVSSEWDILRGRRRTPWLLCPRSQNAAPSPAVLVTGPSIQLRPPT